jgi:hypothetical protein
MYKYIAVPILSLALFGAIANSQMNRPQAQTPSLFATESVPSTDPRSPQQQVARMLQRQAQLRNDTAKLVALITELKQQVDKTNINILSLDVIKKAKEIQKLAKSVQEKMSNDY